VSKGVVRNFLILFALFSFIWTLQKPGSPRKGAFSQKDKVVLDELLKTPEDVILDHGKINKILKILNKGSKKAVSEFYHSVRYRVFDWSQQFGKPQVAPIFEDIAQIYYQKVLPEESPIKVIEQIHKDFDFLCKS
jgi:hypothetical protein